MRQSLRLQDVPDPALQVARGLQGLRVPRLPQEVRPEGQPGGAHPHAHGGEAVFMLHLRTQLYHLVSAQNARKKAQR